MSFSRCYVCLNLVENTNPVFTLQLLFLRTGIRHLLYDYHCFLFEETLFQRKAGPLSARTGRSPSGTVPSCRGRADSLVGLSEQALCLTSIDLPTGGRSARLGQRSLSILPKSFKKELEGRSQEGREGRCRKGQGYQSVQGLGSQGRA